jgi:hypothetical protein
MKRIIDYIIIILLLALYYAVCGDLIKNYAAPDWQITFGFICGAFGVLLNTLIQEALKKIFK